MKQMEVDSTQRPTVVSVTESFQKLPEQEVKSVAEIQQQQQPPDLETAKANTAPDTDETQCSQPESIQNVDEITENEKKTLEVNKSRDVSSHGTLQYVQPRVRFFGRAKEIEQCLPIDKKRHEYRTMIIINENENLITEIYPREVRQQDITEHKIEKYNVVGCQMPEVLDEFTCRDDDT